VFVIASDDRLKNAHVPDPPVLIPVGFRIENGPLLGRRIRGPIHSEVRGERRRRIDEVGLRVIQMSELP
jgi:hypothetical protein